MVFGKKAKLLVALLLALCTVIAMTACRTETPKADLPKMTLEELSVYNGKDGQPAYIAVDGVVYDVSNVSQWRDGEHNGFIAGGDLTEEIKTLSPHGTSKLSGLPVVAELVS